MKLIYFLFSISLAFLFLISMVNAGNQYSDCEIYGNCESASDLISAINYTQVNVNNSIYWGGNAWSDTRWLNIDGSNANQNINIGVYDFLVDDIMADLVWSNSMRIWDDTLNADAILTMYTHDISNSFTLDVNDAGSTDFYSAEQYQFRSGDNLFQIIHDMYTGTYLNINVGNTFPEITSKDGVISFVDENLTTTGNITANYFFGNWNGSSDYYLKSNPYSFYNSTNPPINTSTWSRAGTNTFLTNSGDKIGIGTDNPSAKLDVRGSAYFNNHTNKIYLGSTSGFEAYPGIWFGSSPTTITNYAFLKATGLTALNTPSGGLLTFRVGNNNKMIVNNNGVLINEVYNTGAGVDVGLAIKTGKVGIGTTTPQNKLNVLGDGNFTGYVYSKNQVAQFHREANVTAGATNTWYNITWDLEIPEETTGNWFNLTDSNNSITIVGFDGIVRVQGCIHPYNDNVGVQEASIYARVLVNGIEARCLQASDTKEFRSESTDIIHYVGTVVANDGDVINVQWRTTNTNLVLNGSAIFDNPVSASINFEKIGGLDI